MPDNQPNKKKSITPAKLVLIGILGLVLLFVLLKPNDKPEPILIAKDSSKPEPVASSSPVVKQSRKPRKITNWPKIDLEETIAHNPFVMPDSSELDPENTDPNQNQAENLKRFLSELRNENVSLIIQGPEKSMAVIGERTVQKGDVINGFRIVEIHSDGVVVEVSD